MGSVVTYWSGHSGNNSEQTELALYIAKLAEASEVRWQRAGNPKAIPAHRDSQRTNIVRLDQSIAGRVLVGSSMLLLEGLSKTMQKSARIIDCSKAWQAQASGVSFGIFSRADEQHYAVEIPAVRLQGIAFRLYDPRCLYPGEDWMSFAFLQAPDFPELDGQMVRVLSRQECLATDGDWIQSADWAIDTPSILLRDYLEEWFDLVMAWTKIFFVTDLEYWRNEILNRWDEIKPSIERLIASDGQEVAKQAVFEYILESFESEADQWEHEIARMAKKEL